MPDENNKTVPYERFQALVRAKKQLEDQVADLTGQVQTLTEKGATADTLAGQLRTAQDEITAANGRFDTYKAITSAGITDPDVVEAVEWQYGKLPKEGRPQLADVLKGWKDKPETAPSVLRPHFTAGQGGGGSGAAGAGGQAGNQGGHGGQGGGQGAGAAGGQGAGGAAGGQGAAGAGGQAGNQGGQGGGSTAANAGARPYTGAPSTLNAAQISQLSPEQYREQRAAILAGLKG